MPIDRSTILRGPAVVQYNSQTFYSKGDIILEMGLETFDIEASAFGKVDERALNRVSRVRFTPAGEYEALSTLWPYASTSIGASVFGATDKNLVIHTLDGKTITLKGAAVTRMPSLILSATKTIMGEVEFTAIGANNTTWATAASMAAAASLAFSDTTFDPANIKTQPYTVAWGSAPWDAIQTMEGVTVDFGLSLPPLETDTDGIVDMTFERLEVTARLKPLGITEAQFLAALKVDGTGAARGRSLQDSANDLVITGTGVTVTVYNAQMKAGGMEFGAATPRIGELTFVATRVWTAGTPDPLFAVAT